MFRYVALGHPRSAQSRGFLGRCASIDGSGNVLGELGRSVFEGSEPRNGLGTSCKSTELNGASLRTDGDFVEGSHVKERSTLQGSQLLTRGSSSPRTFQKVILSFTGQRRDASGHATCRVSELVG